MDHSLFLAKDQINNFEEIMYVIFNYGLQEDVLAVENTGDIIYYLDQRDKKRELDDPELKKAVLTIIHSMLATGLVDLDFRYSWVEKVRKNPPELKKIYLTSLIPIGMKMMGSGLLKFIWFGFEEKDNPFNC
jgi:hypothetical protein